MGRYIRQYFILLVFVALGACQTAGTDVYLPPSGSAQSAGPAQPVTPKVYRAPEVSRHTSRNPYGEEYQVPSAPLPKTPFDDAAQAQAPAQIPSPQNFSFTDKISRFLSNTWNSVDVTDGKVRVGILVPLSGPHRTVGQKLLNAASMAVVELGEKDFILQPYDTKGTPQGAVVAARQAVDDNVRLILGPLFSENARAISRTIGSAGTNAIAFTNDRSVAGRGIYPMGHAPEPEVAQVIDYVAEQGITRIAALMPETDYGYVMMRTLQSVAQYYNLEIVASEFYDPKKDFKPAVAKIAHYAARKKALAEEKVATQEALLELEEGTEEYEQMFTHFNALEEMDTFGDLEFDAILLVEGGDTLRALGPLLPFYDIDPEKVHILGTSRWEAIKPWTESSFRGGWFAAADPNYRVAFEQRYLDIYGKAAPRIATLAYDAVALAVALARSKSGASFNHAAITQPNGFVGMDGIFRFNGRNHVERGLAVLEVTRRGLKVIRPAPNTFVN